MAETRTFCIPIAFQPSGSSLFYSVDVTFRGRISPDKPIGETVRNKRDKNASGLIFVRAIQ